MSWKNPSPAIVAKTIRILLSLAVIAAGIYYKNWLGLLGIITLISAFTGACPLNLRFRPPDGPKVDR